jgi:hypothetical protein
LFASSIALDQTAATDGRQWRHDAVRTQWKMTDPNGNATELITWYFVGRIALQFVFMSLVIYLLLNVARIILQTFGLFVPPAPEAPKPPLCTCNKWKYCLRQYTNCPGN